MSKSPHTPTTGSCSTVAQVIQAVTQLGLHADYGGRNTMVLGTFCRELSAFSRVAAAAGIEDLRTTAYGSNFR